MRVSVVGGSTVTDRQRESAVELGRVLARRDHEVVCGGLGGAMAAVCRGAREVGGHTVGILPGEDRSAANPHVETAVATGLGHARNPLVVLNGDAVVAVDGGPGTLTEVGYALVYGRPVAGIDTHDVDGVTAVDSPAAAVEYVERAVESGADPGGSTPGSGDDPGGSTPESGDDPGGSTPGSGDDPGSEPTE